MVWITQAYFVPDEKLLVELQDAAKRGVNGRVLVPGFSDSNFVVNASNASYEELLSSGVKIFEMTSSMLHAKTAVVDGIWSTVGTANLDPRSTLHNDEVNVVVLGTEFATEMENQFNLDLGNSQKITLKMWEKRPLWQRLKELVSRPFSYWL